MVDIRAVHHGRDGQRLRHERRDPRQMPEVRLMAFKRDLGVLSVSLHCSVSPASPLTSSATDVPLRRLWK